MIVYDCPACGSRMKTSEDLAEQPKPCPVCRTLVLAPPPGTCVGRQVAQPPPLPTKSRADRINPVAEFGMFAIGLPVLIGFVTVMFVMFTDGRPGPPIHGVNRGWFIAGPILGASALSAIAGILLLATRRIWALFGCIIGGFLIVLAYLVVLTVATGMVPVNLMTLVLIAGPVLLVVRAPKAIAGIRTGRRDA
jgi:hypothetical protein